MEKNKLVPLVTRFITPCPRTPEHQNSKTERMANALILAVAQTVVPSGSSSLLSPCQNKKKREIDSKKYDCSHQLFTIGIL
jgi:hypothetical protein